MRHLKRPFRPRLFGRRTAPAHLHTSCELGRILTPHIAIALTRFPHAVQTPNEKALSTGIFPFAARSHLYLHGFAVLLRYFVAAAAAAAETVSAGLGLTMPGAMCGLRGLVLEESKLTALKDENPPLLGSVSVTSTNQSRRRIV